MFIKVVENPIINRIALEGNKRIDDDDILPEIFLNPRDIFTLNPKIQIEGIRRNPKTGEKVFVKEKKIVLFKMSKEWAKKINEKE